MSQQLTIAESFAKAVKKISNPQPESRKAIHLRKKRNLDIIERNYIIRRFYKPIDANNEYETESKTYSILNNFEFDSPPYNKFSCIKNISANAFWFLFCSNYFPYLSNELIDLKEYIPDELKKLIDCLNSNLVPIKKNSNYLEKFDFSKELKKIVEKFSKKKNETKEKNNIFQTTSVNSSSTTPSSSSNLINLDETKTNINISNLSCTSNISSIKILFENLIKYFEQKNSSTILSKITKDFILTNNFNRDNRIPEEIELDIKYQTKSFKRLREEIFDKEEQDEEDENDDIVCFVCGDGEYEDDNLILYCSKCNMTVHQKCYGILVVPEGDWICHLCLAFDNVEISKNMECILCPKLGGAMKPCTLKKSSNSYKVMIKNRKSPFLKDNNLKNINLNNNLINFNSNEIKDEKNAEDIINDENSKNENKINNINENHNEINSNISNSQIPEVAKSTNSNQINNPINNTINDFNSSTNIPIFNTPININISNNANPNTNNNNNNINISSPSLNSSNIIKETESICSNSSFNNNKKSEKFESNTNLISSSNINLPNVHNNSSTNLPSKKHQQKKQKTEIYLNEKIAKENAWVHLSCALWLPEITIKNFDTKEKIQGVENISKKRLQEKCDICLKIGYGPTIKCEKCDYRFHPECARRLKRFYLEINENEKAETTFLAYCHGDAPPKNLKKYELIKQRKRDDIKKFSNLIRKDLGNLSKIPEDKQCNIINPYCHCNNSNDNFDEKKILKKLNNDFNMKEDTNKKNNNVSNNTKIELTGSEKKNLINAIREMLIDQSNLTLEINSEDYSIKEYNNINFKFDHINYPERFSWPLLKQSQEYLNGISPFETFKYYRSIVKNEADYTKIILKQKIKPNSKKILVTQIIPNKEKFCICDSSIDQNWIMCESDSKKYCPGNHWYHVSCMAELKDYGVFNRIDAENIIDKYYCSYCRKNYGLKISLKNKEKKEEKNEEKNNNDNDKNEINTDIKNQNINKELESNKKESKVIDYVNINDYKENENKTKIEINSNENETKMEIEEENKKNENEKKEEKKDKK